MITIWSSILLIIILTIILLIIKNISFEDDDKKITLLSSTDTNVQKARDCLIKSNLTISQLLNLKKKESQANFIAQKHACIRRGYGYNCKDDICKCTINNEEQCNIYKNELLQREYYYSPQDISNNKDLIVYWDVVMNKCIVYSNYEYDLESEEPKLKKLCSTIQELDRDNKYNFEYVKPSITCKYTEICDQNISKACVSPCPITKLPSCKIPSSYCSSRGMDHTDINNGDCYVSDLQAFFENNILGPDTIRCAKSGDYECMFKAIDPIQLVADIICKYAGGSENGCGFMSSPFGYLGKGLTIAIPAVVDAFEKGWDATRNFFENTVGDWFTDDVANFFTDDVPEFFTETIPDSFEYAWDRTSGAFKYGGNYIYNEALMPIANGFVWLGDKMGC
jgi:hypothetical protein